MEDLEYTVTENVHRNRAGEIVQIDYLFDETIVTEAPSESSTGLARRNKEKRSHSYEVLVTREIYGKLADRLPNTLSFDAFVKVLRPFITGYYADNELDTAFRILDNDNSGKIQLDELNAFLPILNGEITMDALTNYVKKVDKNFDRELNKEEFRALVLRGIGRDIICNHLD